MTASTASAKSHRSADTKETKFSDRSCNDRPIPPSTRIIDPVSRKVHVRFLAAAGRKVSGPQMFRKHGKYTRPFKGRFSKRHFRVRILHAQPASPVSNASHENVAQLARRLWLRGRQLSRPQFNCGGTLSEITAIANKMRQGRPSASASGNQLGDAGSSLMIWRAVVKTPSRCGCYRTRRPSFSRARILGVAWLALM
jgi:hypothetical protein